MADNDNKMPTEGKEFDVTSHEEEAPEVYALAVPTAEPLKKHTPAFTWHFVVELIFVIIVVILAISVWSLNSDKSNLTKEVASLNANPQAIVQKQTQGIIDAVGRLMQLPSNETPTVASVSDAATAKKQSAFFANARNGDKVLLYAKSGEAILYRPSTNKVILVAPLTFTSSTSGTTTK